MFHFGLRRFPQLLAVFGERRFRLEVERDSIVSPDSGKIFGIERMALDFVFFLGRFDVPVVLTPRTGFPSRTGSDFLYFKSRFFSDDELRGCCRRKCE